MRKALMVRPCRCFSSQGSLRTRLRLRRGDGAEEDLASQQHLAEASRRAMSIDYCREQGGNALTRWMRGTPIDVNYDFRRWRKHQVASRHLQLWSLRNIFRWDLLRRLLFPDLAWLGLGSGLLCLYNVHLAACGLGLMSLPLVTVTMPSFALGLLITFKTQSGYDRFIEGRRLWEHLLRESRALGSRLLLRVPGASGTACTPVFNAQQRALKLLTSFAVALKYHLTEDGCNPHIKLGAKVLEEDVRKATTRAFKAELGGIWSLECAEERAIVDRILSSTAANRPLQILHELEHLNSSVFSVAQLGGLEPPAANEVDRSLTALHNVLGACEKILRTPIYTPYSRFTSRFLFVWCNALPLGLFPILGPELTVPTTLVISFFMLGIEDIGSRVEQPFDVLPLWQYCEDVDASCKQLLDHSKALGRFPGHVETPENELLRQQLGPFVSSISV
ncbi:unnamed protein product [Effrenium voratum]|nr:unnamed protein product [Effrenium voratum]